MWFHDNYMIFKCLFMCLVKKTVSLENSNEQITFYHLIVTLESIEKLHEKMQKQPSKGIPRKRCSENMQQTYRITPMPKCDFNNIAKQLY